MNSAAHDSPDNRANEKMNNLCERVLWRTVEAADQWLWQYVLSHPHYQLPKAARIGVPSLDRCLSYKTARIRVGTIDLTDAESPCLLGLGDGMGPVLLELEEIP